MTTILQAAIDYHAVGLSVVPVLSSKGSIIPWTELQKRRLSVAEIMTTFNTPAVSGIAIVCGAISGGFQGVDLDDKNDAAGCLSKAFLQTLQREQKALFDRLTIAITRNKGTHLYYQSDLIEHSTALARRPATSQELISQPHAKVRVLAETIGEGKYILVPPSPGYRLVQGSLLKVPRITGEERHQLFAIARRFNKYTEPPIIRRHYTQAIDREGSPLNHYNRCDQVIPLLVKHGWTVVRATPLRTYLRRPGTTKHRASGNFHHSLRLFTVFTTSTEFTPRKGYSPSAVFAILECNRDFTLTAKKLLSLGFGIPYKLQGKQGHKIKRHAKSTVRRPAQQDQSLYL